MKIDFFSIYRKIQFFYFHIKRLSRFSANSESSFFGYFYKIEINILLLYLILIQKFLYSIFISNKMIFLIFNKNINFLKNIIFWLKIENFQFLIFCHFLYLLYNSSTLLLFKIILFKLFKDRIFKLHHFRFYLTNIRFLLFFQFFRNFLKNPLNFLFNFFYPFFFV